MAGPGGWGLRRGGFSAGVTWPGEPLPRPPPGPGPGRPPRPALPSAGSVAPPRRASGGPSRPSRGQGGGGGAAPAAGAGPHPRGGPPLAALPVPSAPQHLPGAGDAARRPGDGRRRRMLPRRPRRAERSAQLDPSLQLQVPAPPPPAANGGSPAAPQRLPIGCGACPSGGTAGRAARSPAGLDGAHPPGHRGRAPPALRGPRLLERGQPVPSRSPPGWLETRARPAARRGARPRGGEGDPSAPNRGSSRSPPVPPAPRTRPELPLPVRVPAAAGAGPDGSDRAASAPGDKRGTHGPERGARPAGRSRPLPSQTFLQRDPSKGFSASTPHFDIPRLSQDPAS
ncbi:basic proline-rich protein-like [Corvus moneduloides]|uniref:basic proline-rich protein-like n=1 Tax=Corvus moneduloides TaxID=1196302 RepID=UPI001363F6B7|nr:basic proline-rich protein-like [Corvus moneduloides]